MQICFMMIDLMSKPAKRPKESLFSGLGPAIIMIIFFVLVVIVTLVFRHRLAELFSNN